MPEWWENSEIVKPASEPAKPIGVMDFNMPNSQTIKKAESWLDTAPGFTGATIGHPPSKSKPVVLPEGDPWSQPQGDRVARVTERGGAIGQLPRATAIRPGFNTKVQGPQPVGSMPPLEETVGGRAVEDAMSAFDPKFPGGQGGRFRGGSGATGNIPSAKLYIPENWRGWKEEYQQAKGKVLDTNVLDIISHLPGSALVGLNDIRRKIYETAKDKLARGDYGPTSEYQMTPMGGYMHVRYPSNRDGLVKTVKDYEKREMIGEGVISSVMSGIADLPSYMGEMAAGGIGQVSGVGGAAKFSAKMLGIQFGRIEDAIGRQMDKGERGYMSFAKGIGDVYIENLSETAGAGFPVIARKLPFAGKIFGSMEKYFKSTGMSTNEFWKRMGSQVGYNGLLGEWGEERLATVMKGMVNVDDFGAGPQANADQRIIAGLAQDMTLSNQLVEIGVLATPMVAQKLGTATYRGKVQMDVEEGPDEFYLKSIQAKPTGTGAGTSALLDLMQKSEETGKPIRLQVGRVTDQAKRAKALYDRLGFQEVESANPKFKGVEMTYTPSTASTTGQETVESQQAINRQAGVKTMTLDQMRQQVALMRQLLGEKKKQPQSPETVAEIEELEASITELEKLMPAVSTTNIGMGYRRKWTGEQKNRFNKELTPDQQREVIEKIQVRIPQEDIGIYPAESHQNIANEIMDKVAPKETVPTEIPPQPPITQVVTPEKLETETPVEPRTTPPAGESEQTGGVLQAPVEPEAEIKPQIPDRAKSILSAIVNRTEEFVRSNIPKEVLQDARILLNDPTLAQEMIDKYAGDINKAASSLKQAAKTILAKTKKKPAIAQAQAEPEAGTPIQSEAWSKETKKLRDRIAKVIRRNPIYQNALEGQEVDREKFGYGKIFVPEKYRGEVQKVIGDHPHLQFVITYDRFAGGKHFDEAMMEIGEPQMDIGEFLERLADQYKARSKTRTLNDRALEAMASSNDPDAVILAGMYEMYDQGLPAEEIIDNIREIATYYEMPEEGIQEYIKDVQEKQRVVSAVQRKTPPPGPQQAKAEKSRQKDLIGRPVLEGGSRGQQQEFFDKEKFKTIQEQDRINAERDIEGQQAFLEEKEKPKRLISQEAYEKAKKRLMGRGTLRSGVDPQGLADMMTIGAYHFENGVRKFADWSKKMVADLGEKVKPYLDEIWVQVSHLGGPSGGVDWLTAVRQGLDKSKLKRRVVRVEQKKERSRRAGAYEGTVKWLISEGVPAKEAIDKATGMLKGPLTEYRLYEGLDQFIDQSAIDAGYMDIATTNRLRPYERKVVKDAFAKLENGEVLTPYDVRMIKKWRPELAEIAEKRVPLLVKMFSKVEQLLGMLKFGAAFDIQMRRQARWLRARHPKLYTRTVGKNLGAYISQKYADKIAKEVENDPRYDDAVDHGVRFLERKGETAINRPEQYISSWGEKVPLKIGKVYAASMRGFVDSFNWLQQQLWNVKLEQWEKNGITITEEMLHDLADFNNTYLGLSPAKTNFGRSLRRVLAPVMWSPTLTWSRVRTPGMILTNKTMRIETAVTLSSYIASGLMFLVAASFLARALKKKKDPVEWDPRSSDFGKIRVGNTRIDVYGDGGPYIRAFMQFVTGKKKNQAGRPRKRPRFEVIKQFVRNKRAPFFDFLGKVWSGRTYYGGPAWEMPDWAEIKTEGDLKEMVAKTGGKITETKVGQIAYLIGRETISKFAPFFVQSAIEASWYDGWPIGLWAGAEEFFSGQALSYEPSTYSKLQMVQDIGAVQQYDILWDDLSPKQQQKIRKMIPEIDDLEEKLARERLPLEEIDLREQNKTADKIMRSLPEDVQKELNEYGVRVSGLSRRIGENFRLNDNRYRLYEELSIKYMTDRLTKQIRRPDWKTKTSEQKEKLLKHEMNSGKTLARNQLKQLMEKGTP